MSIEDARELDHHTLAYLELFPGDGNHVVSAVAAAITILETGFVWKDSAKGHDHYAAVVNGLRADLIAERRKGK